MIIWIYMNYKFQKFQRNDLAFSFLKQKRRVTGDTSTFRYTKIPLAWSDCSYLLKIQYSNKLSKSIPFFTFIRAKFTYTSANLKKMTSRGFLGNSFVPKKLIFFRCLEFCCNSGRRRPNSGLFPIRCKKIIIPRFRRIKFGFLVSWPIPFPGATSARTVWFSGFYWEGL